MHKRDIILISSIVCVALIILLFTSASSKGNTVVVYVDNSEYASFPLDSDTEFVIKSSDDNINVLTIKNGEAYISSASCKDKICVHHGNISKENELIVCLPNKVVITVERKE